jgi:hypothetical protein
MLDLRWQVVDSNHCRHTPTEVVARRVAETIGLTTDDEAGLVYVSILGGEIRMV